MARGLFAGPAQQPVESRFVPIPFEDLAAAATIKQARYDESAMGLSALQEEVGAQVPVGFADMMHKQNRMDALRERLDGFRGRDLASPEVRREIQSLRGDVLSDPIWANMEINRERAKQYESLLNEARAKYPEDPWLWEDAAEEFGMFQTFGSSPVPQVGWAGQLSDSPSIMEPVDVKGFLSDILTKLKPNEFVKDDATKLITSRDETGGVSLERVLASLGINYDKKNNEVSLDNIPPSIRNSDLGRQLLKQADFLARADSEEYSRERVESMAADLYLANVMDYANAYAHTKDIKQTGLQSQLLSRKFELEDKAPTHPEHIQGTSIGISASAEAEIKDQFNFEEGSKLTRFIAEKLIGKGSGIAEAIKLGDFSGARKKFADSAVESSLVAGAAAPMLLQRPIRDFANLVFDMETYFSPHNNSLPQDLRKELENSIDRVARESGITVEEFQTMSPRDKHKTFAESFKKYLNSYQKTQMLGYDDVDQEKKYRERGATLFLGAEKGFSAQVGYSHRGGLGAVREIYTRDGEQILLDELFKKSKLLSNRKSTTTATYRGMLSPNNRIGPGFHLITIGKEDYFIRGFESEEQRQMLPHLLTSYDRSFSGVGTTFEDGYGNKVTPKRSYRTDERQIEVRYPNDEIRVFTGRTIEDAYREHLKTLQ